MPYRESQVQNYSRSFAGRLLSAFQVDPGGALFAAPSVGLWSDPAFNPTPLSVPTDFDLVECDFSGYARQGVSFSGVVNLQPSLPGIVGSVAFETADDDPFIGNTIYGYWIVAGGEIVAFERFQDGQEVPIGVYGDFLGLDLNLPDQLTQEALAT